MEGLATKISCFGETYRKYDTDHLYSYGTAGFRCCAIELPPVLCKVGIFAALRAKLNGKAIGVMITASHNPVHDNGVKIISETGEMLEQEWEHEITKIVNTSFEDLPLIITEIAKKYCLDLSSPSYVFVGSDNRPSSPILYRAFQEGVLVFEDAICYNFGHVTTPFVHYTVNKINKSAIGLKLESIRLPIVMKTAYAEHFYNSFVKFMELISLDKNDIYNLYIDVANGVAGSFFMEANLYYTKIIKFVLVNNKSSSLINDKCGSDFVKSRGCFPTRGFSEIELEENARCLAFDGDADRIVYFTKKGDETVVFDGDDLCCLFAVYIEAALLKLGLIEHTKIAVVYTGYTNNGNLNFLKQFKNVSLICTSTGVKNLHNVAKQYDIGIYFESNGHGTVLFSEEFKSRLNDNCINSKSTFQVKESVESTELESSLIELFNTSSTTMLQLWMSIDKYDCDVVLNSLIVFTNMSNQQIGDALSNMFLAEALFNLFGLNICDFLKLYKKYSVYLSPVKVLNKSKFVLNPSNEQILDEPSYLQDYINGKIEQHSENHLRIFVRPSGTENIIRVYIESNSHRLSRKITHDTVCFIKQREP